MSEDRNPKTAQTNKKKSKLHDYLETAFMLLALLGVALAIIGGLIWEISAGILKFAALVKYVFGF